MRSLLLAASLLASTASAQTFNVFEIHSCTNFTSRGSVGTNPGDLLMKVPSSRFQGVGQDATGAGTTLLGFRYFLQDQNAATIETYSLIIRADNAGQPDATAAGVLLQTTSLSSPGGTGIVAWQVTVTLTTPSTVVPLCNTFYTGANVGPAPGWSATDGISFHIGTQAILNGTAAGNPAPGALASEVNLAWDIINGTGGTPAQPGGVRVIRFAHLVPPSSAVLNLGNTDPTLVGNTANCVSTLLNPAGHPRCTATGGMYPAGSVARSDGLDCRIRDLSNAGGVFVTFLGSSLGCPGLPLGSLANGALYLNPGGTFLQVASGTLAAGTGEGTAIMLPPGVAQPSWGSQGVTLEFQAFTVGPAFALPGNLTNLASVSYRP
jgi:hypothetical protein